MQAVATNKCLLWKTGKQGPHSKAMKTHGYRDVYVQAGVWFIDNLRTTGQLSTTAVIPPQGLIFRAEKNFLSKSNLSEEL